MIRLLLAVLLAVPGIASAASFDCRQPPTAVERRICADPRLSRLDDRLARAYRTSRQAFGPGAEGAAAVLADLEAAQSAWVTERNACAKLRCLRRAYTRQLAVLEFRGRPGSRDPVDAWAGRYGHGGFIELLVQVRDDRSVRIAIDGAEPSAGRWTCAYAGIAQIDGAAAASTGGLSLLHRPGTVDVPDTPANVSVAKASCGVNGTLIWRYMKATRR